ncbi:MAG: hypothetical protein JNJ55_09245, partial [Betaproteobacteria bacterium]|nr:hypothetical protein [Betaproteobacteria bacterium]
ADLDAGREFLGLAQGIADAATRRVVSHDWALWRGEVTWMTLYFSIGVWVSLAMTRWPALMRDVVSRAPRAATGSNAPWPHAMA